MNCLPTSKCTEREFDTTKYIVSNCNVIEVTLTQKQNTDCTTEFVSLLDASGNSYPETSEFVSVNNQISRVIIDGLSTCVADAMGGGSTIPTVQDCDGNDAVPVYDPCAITAINTAKDAIVAAINGRPDYTAQLTSIGDTLTAMKSDTVAINTGVASALVLLQAIVDKPDPTPVDLQPVLDRLDALIALETTENSTLVDVKNQLIAANVTLSNAETLLTHIDADMHDVVAKLQSVIDLLTSLQTLLTTIDGHIVAVKSAITTADANNVSALNDVKTALQAININTDTIEALITAGNALLRAIASNTDEVEGLLRALRTSVDSIAALFAKKYAQPSYSYRTSLYIVSGIYKSLTVTFINEGTINGTYAPAGYSFSHPREIDVTYSLSVALNGTGFAVWEDR